ncbi:MAG: ABC transporter substrate-binding protein [Oscillospiraceae bacterium]
MKKLVSLVLCLALAFSLVACSSAPKKDVAAGTGVQIRILGQSVNEAIMNIMRDQLTKAGFDVKLDTQPDYSSYKSAVAAGAYDLAVTGWTTVTGNPDYATRDIFITGGAYNTQPLSDPKVDELINKAAAETPAQYVATYTELENYLVTEQAYIVPLYSSLRIQAINNKVLDVKTVRQPKSRSGVWEAYSYMDKALNATRPLVMTQTNGTLTSLDPIQANDGSVNALSSNMNIRLVNLTDEDEVTAVGSLSRNYSIAEGNDVYYFLLRDDVNFAKIQDKKAADSGVRVGAEDVKFTLDRAKDKTSVAVHKTYTLHEHMKNVEILTDLNELNTVKDSDTGKPVLETLVAGVESPVKALTADKTKANNAKGTYQVIKITTTEPFPQVLNYLAHQSAGILNKEQVTAYNSKFDVAKYDATKDVCYGDFNAIKSGNNMLYTSGPYTLVSVDDISAEFQKNPGYMKGTEFEPKIEKISIKFIKDNTSAVSAFRAGEIDLLGNVPTTDVATVEANKDFTVQKRSSNGVSYAAFNLSEGSICADQDVRLAVLNAINQEDFIKYNSGLVNPAYSTVSTIIETGNVHKQDLAKSAEHVAAYQAKAAKK